MSEPTRRTWGDIGWVVIFTPSEYYVDIMAWEIAAEDDEGLLVGQSSQEMSHDPNDVTPIVRGSIKWDGCSNLDMGEEDCMWHHCSRASLLVIGELLARTFDVAMLLMGPRADKTAKDWPDSAWEVAL
jgi:hypothetical protein